MSDAMEKWEQGIPWPYSHNKQIAYYNSASNKFIQF